jgi:hypothetical protein
VLAIASDPFCYIELFFKTECDLTSAGVDIDHLEFFGFVDLEDFLWVGASASHSSRCRKTHGFQK